jgi:adenylate cyclase class 2
MPKEFETHLLKINREEIVAKLEALGAKKIKDVLQRRLTFDYPDRRLDAERAFIRVRDEGDGQIKLAYKCHQPLDSARIDCEEIEFSIESLEKARQFFIAIGLPVKQYIETKRLEYQLGDLIFDLDEWPKLAPFLEIEGPSKERVFEGVQMLGYLPSDTTSGHAGDFYELQGMNDWRDWPEIKF